MALRMLVLLGVRRRRVLRRGRVGGAQHASALLPVHIPALPAKSESVTGRCPIPARFRPAFVRAAHDTGFQLSMLVAVAQVESRFKAERRSTADARGLLQVTPTTAAELKLNVDDPSSNVLAGARYLKIMLDRFQRTDLALAAYNAGPTAVDASAVRRAGDADVRRERPAAVGGPRRLLLGGLTRVVLAAGASSRYGVVPPKQVELLRACSAALRQSARRRRRRRQRRARARDVESVRCPDWERGPGASLRCGLAALPAEAEAAVVVLADGPELDPRAIDRVVESWRAEGGDVGRRGVRRRPPASGAAGPRRPGPSCRTRALEASRRALSPATI